MSAPRLWLVVAAYAALGGWALLASPAPGIDDAHIFYRFADHLAAGHGFVFNVGGERVEGVTSLSWTAILAAGRALGLAPESIAPLLGWLLGMVSLVMAHGLARRVLGSSGVALAATAAMLLNPAWVLWTAASGMETSLYGLLLLATTLAWVDDRPGAVAGWGLVLALTRPEGALLLTVAAAERIRRGRRGAAPLALALAALAILLLWRHHHFGHWLPNTFYAKVDGLHVRAVAEGGYYLLRHAAVYAIWWGGLALALPAVRGAGSRATRVTAGVLAGSLAVYVAAGGDHFAGWRHLQYTWPHLVVLAFAGGLRWARTPARRRLATVAVVLWAALAWVPLSRCLDLELELAARGRVEGRWLRSHVPDHRTVGGVLAGAVPYASERRSFDVLGLGSAAVAHARRPRFGHGPKNHESFDLEVFLETLPHVLWHGLDLVEGRYAPDPVEAALMPGLLDDARFDALYVPRRALLPDGRVHAFFLRRDAVGLGDP